MNEFVISQAAKPFWKEPESDLVAHVPLVPTYAFGQIGLPSSVELVIAIIRAFSKLIQLANLDRY